MSQERPMHSPSDKSRPIPDLARKAEALKAEVKQLAEASLFLREQAKKLRAQSATARRAREQRKTGQSLWP